MERVILLIHIVAGSIALLTALIALLTAKGKGMHVKAGRIYALAMTLVFVTALPLAIWGSDIFLLLIAIFSFYLVFAGWRFARNRRGHPHPADWAAVILMGLAGLGMWGYGVVLWQARDSQWVTMVLFGGIALALGLVDAQTYWRQTAKGVARIARHLTNMMAGTIATVTAVVVTNVDTRPEWLGWILPTLVLTPLIVWWNIRIQRPKGNRRKSRAPA